MKKINLVAFACVSALFCITTAVASHAQSFTTLGLFNGGNGRFPNAALIQATDGNFYGVTATGGPGGGSIFRLSPSGTITPLYNFCSQSGCPDGKLPDSLIQANNGNFYGTTYYGGTGSYCPANTGGCGTVFEITPKGKLTTIYNFCSQANCADGALANGLILGPNGNLYGTTVGYNGFPSCIGTTRTGCGTIFEITPAGQSTTLHQFCSSTNCSDGYGPFAPVTLGNDGNFYGTTVYGGANLFGVAFKMTPQGAFTTLYNFCSQTNCADGGQPLRGVIQGSDGYLYGTTADHNNTGCNFQGCGTIFRMTRGGQLITVYDFCPTSGCPDGWISNGLTQGSDGNIYGTTQAGGANNDGAIFQLSAAGQYSNLFSFVCMSGNCNDGTDPDASLLQATNGLFYGTTNSGGVSLPPQGPGVAFSFDMGLPAFVAAQVNVGRVGQVATILGNNLTGATSVTFNGVSAAFKVGSSTFLKAQIPTGATTGTIQVTTPSGTLNSNVAFQVLP